MTMKVLKIVVITMMLCSLGVVLPGCAPSESVAESHAVTVQRGDLTVDITASGNLALSVVEDLAFEISGTVEEVMVEEGDSVEEGQLLAKLDTAEWEKELITLERNLLQAKIALDKAEEETCTSIGDIGQSTTDPREIEIKELDVELAETRLAETLDASPEIIAPSDGFITKINVEGGDEVLKGTVALQIADPNKFEADILVSEMDIQQVKLGGEAWVQVGAVQGMSLPAEVTHISPTAYIQSGVVNYQVKVEVESLEASPQKQQEARIQQKQAAKQVSPAIPEGFQLRQGMTVTVSIIVAEREDVLLVPNAAITTSGKQTYVQVVSPDGILEERSITTGISNWQYTEVTDGISEGEEVVIPQGTAATTTTPEQKKPPVERMIPGMRGK